MGKRLHVATKYEVSYQNGYEAFNWMIDEINVLFNALCLDIVNCNEDDTDMGVSPLEFEVYKNQFEDAIKDLENLDTLDDEEEKENIEEALKPFYEEGYTLEQIISSLKTFLEKSDKNNDEIHFCFF